MSAHPDMNLPTLYFVNGSIPSWQVMCALHEKEIAYHPHRLRVMGATRQTREPDFLAINPRGEAPVWVDTQDGVTLRESKAILLYLEHRYGDVPLLPDEPGDRARVLECMFDVHVLRAAYRPLEQLFRGAEALSEYELERARQAPARVSEELATWEHRLADHDFIASSAYSMADCIVYPVLGYMMRRGLELGAWPGLSAYVEMMRERPSSKRAHPEGWTKPAGKMNLFARASALPG